MLVEPVTLTGQSIRLEPMSMEHLPGLCLVGLEPILWRWIPKPITTEEEMREYMQTALDDRRRGLAMPFVIVEQATNQIIGSTRYGNIDTTHRRIEIGWTWLAPAFQRTRANTEAKLLLLTHAFEVLGVNRVELKTDSLNEQSRNAISRIGGVEEGIFRNHMVTASGRLRHTVYFSIIDGEWPDVKAKLEARLRR